MYIYWWHAAELGALQVGHDDDPAERVAQYCADHGLAGADLRGYRLPPGGDADWAESELCHEIEAEGFHRLDVQLEGETHPFHDLDGRPFEEAHRLLSQAARRLVLGAAADLPRAARGFDRSAVDVEVEYWELAPPDPLAPPEPAPPPQPLVPPRPPARLAPPSRPRRAVRAWVLGLGGAAAALMLVAALHSGVLRPGAEPPAVAAVPAAEASVPAPAVTVAATPPPVATLAPVGASPAAPVAVPPAAPAGPAALKEAPLAAAPIPAAPVQPTPIQAAPIQAAPAQAPPIQAPPVQVSRPPAAVTPPAAAAVPRVAPVPAAPAPPRTAATDAAPPEAAGPRPRGCKVSRPKPGLQVYLVSCPNSWAMIGRTVDTPTGWTVSEGANADEAVDFFMHSRHAR